jgi:hypothetical protein
MSLRTFRTIEDMESFYYGNINKEFVQKADASIISSTTGYRNVVYGAKVWSQINFEANPFAALPKEPWEKTGWRLMTATGDSYPSGALAEGAASNYTELPDTLTPTWATISKNPAMIGHTWGMTAITAMLDGLDDSISIAEVRATKGKSHGRAMGAYLVQACDTPNTNAHESIDRICSSKAMASTDYLSAATDPDVFGIDRSASSLYDAQVSAGGDAAGSIRDLTISLVDGVWASVAKAGGRPKVIFTGHNTIKVWSALLEAERRFNAMQIAYFVPRYNGASGVSPGVEAGFNVATYNGVPIIPCQDYTTSIATARTGEVAPIALLDTDYIRYAVLRPTGYLETDLGKDMLTGDRLATEGFYFTVGMTRCYHFPAQGKVRDIQ